MRWLTLLLACCAGATPVRADIQVLSLTVLRGEGRFNDIRQKAAEDVVVQALDEAGRPVVGARVTFSAPAMGAGGTFRDGQRTLSTETDREGKALASGFRPNSMEGRFPLRVTAAFEGRTASILVWQSNTLASGGKGKARKALVLLGMAGGAIAGGVVALTGGKTTPAAPAAVAAAPPPTSLSVGAVTIGPPR